MPILHQKTAFSADFEQTQAENLKFFPRKIRTLETFFPEKIRTLKKFPPKKFELSNNVSTFVHIYYTLNIQSNVSE